MIYIKSLLKNKTNHDLYQKLNEMYHAYNSWFYNMMSIKWEMAS